MAFILRKGRALIDEFPVSASVTFTNGDLVYAGGSGTLIPADSTSGDHIGVIMQSIASTDSDFASVKRVLVCIPKDDTVFEADVTGTLTTAMVGNRYDLSDAGTVDCTGTSKKVVTCVGYISATKGLFKINAVVQNADVATT